MNTSNSLWNGGDQRSNTNRMDQNSILRNVAYQLSTPMPISPDSPAGKSESTQSSSRSDTKSESLCRRLGIDPLDLVYWMQNIRIWISQTILSRVVKEIAAMNKKLMSCGLGDCLIGHVGVERLRKCAALPQFRGHLTELNNLLAFLDITVHQEYLVQRLQELSKGNHFSNYWNISCN